MNYLYYSRRGGRWHSYRLGYIQTDNLEILPTIFSTDLRSQRRLTVRYKVAPAIGRGNMAQHFEEMAIVGMFDEGWVEVTGKTTNLFDAYRTLLRLGSYCVVLEPQELVSMMWDAAEGMMQLYQKYHLFDDTSSEIESQNESALP